MDNITWPTVAFFGLVVILILGLFALLIWTAKYWDVFEDKK